MSKIINVLHILLFAPALLFIATNPSWNTTLMQWTLIALSMMVFLYHVTKQRWVSWFHVIVVAPLLLTLGL